MLMQLRKEQNFAALLLTGPFVIAYAVLFIYPTTR